MELEALEYSVRKMRFLVFRLNKIYFLCVAGCST